MVYPPLRRGARNPAVASMKAGVRRALAAKGERPRSKGNDAYGTGTVLDVRRFKRLYRVGNTNGSNFGSTAWRVLVDGGFLGDYDRMRIRSHNRRVAAAKAAAVRSAREVGARAALAGVALRVYAERWRYLYSQTRPYSRALFSGGRFYDCSSMATVIYLLAGRPDPNGRGFDGYGFTGTMDSRGPVGSWTSSPKAGDLAFYGPGRYGTTHVAIHISPTEVVSFGSNPVRRLPVRYRGDYVGSKTYPLGV